MFISMDGQNEETIIALWGTLKIDNNHGFYNYITFKQQM